MRFFFFLLLCMGSADCLAQTLTAEERRSILDAARPVAAEEAQQPVRIKVERLNVDGGWAVLVGELVSPAGKALDWNKTDCHPDLDKMLWVVLHKTRKEWRVRHIEICASEPPYWYLEQYGGIVWPCGVYAGLERGGAGTIEDECRRRKKNR